jgi:ribose-phosphate pyrophosphokinase
MRPDSATAVIVDDLTSTGNTLLRATRAARKAGAQRVIAPVTHGLFLPGFIEAIADPAIDPLVVTVSVPAFRLGTHSVCQKIDMLPCGGLLADAIRRLHNGASLDDLFVF